MRWLYIVWFTVGIVMMGRGQEMVEMRIYGELELVVGKGDGVYVIDSMDMVMLIGLCRGLKEEVEACGGVVEEVIDCDSLLRAGESLVMRERDIWKRESELLSGRGDWYMERMKEEMGRGKRLGLKWGMWGGVIGGVAGFVLGAVIIK